MNKNDGGPAFPVAAYTLDTSSKPMLMVKDGMTLRDYFAAKAMQGICASKDEAGVLLQHGHEWIAQEAYRIAVAMLKEREKP